MANIKLTANKRDLKGRKVKSLREEGVLPANIFGKKIDSQTIKLDYVEFMKTLEDAGETTLIDLEVDGKSNPVLISEVQTDPVTDRPIHVDFLHVDLKEKVTAEVPVELIGESPAERQALGTVVQYLDELEVEALPAELPEKFEVTIDDLKDVDDTIFVKDVEVEKDKVEIQNDPDLILAKVEPPREEEEEAPALTEEELLDGEVLEGEEGVDVEGDEEGKGIAPGQKPGEPASEEEKN